VAAKSSKHMSKKSIKKGSKSTKSSSAKKYGKKHHKKTSKSSNAKTAKSSNCSKVSVTAMVQYIQDKDKLVTKGSKYKKSMNDLALAHCSQGKTLKKMSKLLGVSRRTIIYWRERHCSFSDSIKRGYAIWLEKLPDLLLAHLSNGYSYTAFAGEINRSKDFLYALERKFDDFMEAKQIGTAKSQGTWEGMGMRQIMGEMTIDLGEVPLMGNGQVIKDDDGKTMLVRKIVPARYSDRTFTFMLQNRFTDYKPAVDNSNDEILDDLKEAIAEVNGGADNGQEMGIDSEDIE